MFSLVATHFGKSVIRYFRRDTLAKSITVLLFLVIIGVLTFLIHIGFYFGFSYIAKDSFFGEAISLYVIELFLLVSSVLVFASALVSGMVLLFRADDGPVLLASPRYVLKPWLIFVRMFLSSLWPLLVVIVPALVAIVRVFHLSVGGLFLALMASILLIFIVVLFAMLTLFLTTAMLYIFRVFSKRHLVTLNTFAFFTLLGIVWSRFHAVNLAEFFQARILSRAVPDLTPILEQFEIFPSHLVAMVIYHSEHNVLVQSVISLAFLLVLSAVLFLLFHYSTRYYLRYWQVAQEGAGIARHATRKILGETLIMRATSARSALLMKECILFVRNPRGMLWLGFIFLIWGIQSASSFLLVRGLGVERVTESAVPLIAGAFQFALVVYFMSMFALRFAFPSFSEERKTTWVIGSAPLSLPNVYDVKLNFFTILFCTFAIAFTVLNVSIIGYNANTTPLLFAMIIVAIITITVCALSLGALFPNNETDDPEVLSTTLPGLSFITLALMYGAVGAIIFRGYTLYGEVGYIVLFFLCSILACIALIRTAKKSLTLRYLA